MEVAIARIDFQNPQGLSKPGNLQNSAVLRMLEEEDSRQRNGQCTGLQNGFHPLRQQFGWPPKGYTTNQRHNPYSNAKISATKRVAWPPAREGSEEYVEQSAAQSQGGPQNPLQSPPRPDTVQPQPYHQNNVPQPSAKNYLEPLSVITNTSSQQYILPQSPIQNHSPVGFSNAPSRRWAPVQSPLSPKVPTAQVEPLYYAPKQTTPATQIQQQDSNTRFPLPSPLSPKLPSYQANLNAETQKESFYTPQQARAVFETKISSPPSAPRQIKSPIQLVPDNIIAQTGDSENNFCTPKQARAFFEPTTRAAAVNNNYNSPPQSEVVSSSPVGHTQITVVSPNRELVSPREFIIPVKREYDPPNPVSPTPIVPKSLIVAAPAPPREVIIPVYRQASYEQKQPVSNLPSNQYQYTQDQNQFSSHPHQYHQQRTTEAILPIKVAGQNSSQVPAQQYNSVQNHQSHQQQALQSPQYYQPPARTVEPPPSIITLRPEAPVSQAPAPVYTSQPATATLKGGKNLRGDTKWPPEDVRERMTAEEAGRMALAQGPACRPRRINKDYSGFFAQHAVNSTYPGYKIPPGTQFYEHQPMM